MSEETAVPDSLPRPENFFKLDGQIALVTGASRGIGAETARIFAKAGANVALLARSQDDIADLAGEIGDKAVAIPCNVARFHEVQAAVDMTLQAFGRLDVLVNNAGVIDPIAPLAQADNNRAAPTTAVTVRIRPRPIGILQRRRSYRAIAVRNEWFRPMAALRSS